MTDYIDNSDLMRRLRIERSNKISPSNDDTIRAANKESANEYQLKERPLNSKPIVLGSKEALKAKRSIVKSKKKFKIRRGRRNKSIRTVQSIFK